MPPASAETLLAAAGIGTLNLPQTWPKTPPHQLRTTITSSNLSRMPLPIRLRYRSQSPNHGMDQASPDPPIPADELVIARLTERTRHNSSSASCDHRNMNRHWTLTTDKGRKTAGANDMTSLENPITPRSGSCESSIASRAGAFIHAHPVAAGFVAGAVIVGAAAAIIFSGGGAAPTCGGGGCRRIVS